MPKSGRRGGGRRNPSPNDQRSNGKNPNNQTYSDARDNRANQLKPQHSTYHTARRESSTQSASGGEYWDYDDSGEITLFH